MTDFEQLPAPLTPPDCNLRGLLFVPQRSPNLTDWAVTFDGVSGSVGYT